MSVLQSILISNILISLFSLIGITTIVSRWWSTKTSISIMVSFAAGVMLSAAFLSILPEALEATDTISVFRTALLGVVVGFFMERGLLWYHHHHEETHNIKPSAYLVIIGDALHNFIDGLAIAATFIVNPAAGLTTVIAIAAHEIPQEFADFTVLLQAGFDKKRALLMNFFSALTAVLGGYLGYTYLVDSGWLVGPALAFSAGIFLYIATADLIPELHRENQKSSLVPQSLAFVLGILLIMYITQTFVE